MAHGKTLELQKIKVTAKIICEHKYPNRQERRREASINKTPVEDGRNVPFRRA